MYIAFQIIKLYNLQLLVNYVGIKRIYGANNELLYFQYFTTAKFQVSQNSLKYLYMCITVASLFVVYLFYVVFSLAFMSLVQLYFHLSY